MPGRNDACVYIPNTKVPVLPRPGVIEPTLCTLRKIAADLPTENRNSGARKDRHLYPSPRIVVRRGMQTREGNQGVRTDKIEHRSRRTRSCSRFLRGLHPGTCTAGKPSCSICKGYLTGVSRERLQQGLGMRRWTVVRVDHYMYSNATRSSDRGTTHTRVKFRPRVLRTATRLLFAPAARDCIRCTKVA